MDTSVGQGSQVQGLDILQSDQSRMEVGTDIDFEQCPESFLKSWRNQRCYLCDDFWSSESTHHHNNNNNNNNNNKQPQQHEPVEPHINFTTTQQLPAQAFCDSIPCPCVGDHHGSLLEQLRSLCETVPEKWTIPQIKARLTEIKAENKVNPESTLKGKLKNLHQASRLKGNLMEHLKDLGIPVNPNRTISQMVAQGEKEIHALFEPEDNEFVGFGKYGDKTYLEVWSEHPSYASWVLTTNQESDSPHWRLRRFARWLQQQKHQKAIMEVNIATPTKTSSKADSSVGSFTVVETKGYLPGQEHPVQTQMVQELAELEQMRQTLQNKIQAVAEQEAALQVEKATLSHTEGRHKNRKEM